MRKLLQTMPRLILLTLTMMFLVNACEFRPLDEVGNTHYVRIYIDEQIQNTTVGFYDENHDRPVYRRPEVMRVTLAHRKTGKVVAERYLRNQGDDENGHYYDGYIICEPGEWNLLAWNFDTESTQIEEPSEQYKAKAYTNRIASHLYSSIPSRTYMKADDDKKYDNEKIVYEPDHLFVAESKDVKAGYSMEVDTLRNSAGEYFRASTIVEAWYIQVNVKGTKYLSSALSLINGLGGAKKLVSADLDIKSPVTVYFDMTSTEKSKSDDDMGVVYATFYTFGKIPDVESGLEVTFDIFTTYGKPVSATFDITDEFGKEMAKNHRWIILDKTIEIPDPPDDGNSGGGFSPGVDDWKDMNTDLTI